MTADVHVQDCGVREREMEGEREGDGGRGRGRWREREREMEGDGGRERYRCSVVSVKSLVRLPRVARADRNRSLR